MYYANRAAAFLGAKKYTQALKDCESSLHLNPKNIKAIRRAISACYETGDYEKGLSYCEKFNDMGFEDKEVTHLSFKMNMVSWLDFS